jgi:hypothetical protein
MGGLERGRPFSRNGLGGIRIRELSGYSLSFPRPPRCQRGDHTKLIYQPSNTVSINKNHLSIMLIPTRGIIKAFELYVSNFCL